MSTAIASKFAKFESTNGDYKAVNLGKLVDVFNGYDFRFQDSNVGKKATFVFYDKEDATKTLTVVLSKKLDDMYRTGKIVKLQLIGCDVVEMDLMDTTTGNLIAEGVLRLQAPTSGISKMGAQVAQDYVDVLAGF
jgi:hypothetical protein